MATRQRPPRARLRLSLTPPLSHGGTHEPHLDAATSSRPEQERRPQGSGHSSSRDHQRSTQNWIPRLRNLYRASSTDTDSRRLPRNRASAQTDTHGRHKIPQARHQHAPAPQ
ncbi:hypothetical protein RRG08_060712 [Elysia crispata]|uniref:Uncharacterized protein n=1 Tax=Elysia crispata TaxID=231223 RepID=A0AAE0YK83_9GAST|nr:hypothetical protein RRG08_060712 [Elysia crispata]